LIQKSLVQHREDRYQVHELIRQFAVAELQRIDQPEQVGRRYPDYFRAWAGERIGLFHASDRSDILAQIDEELDNLRQALRVALDNGYIEEGARLCTTLRDYWRMRAAHNEAIAWYEAFLSREGLSAPTRGLLLSATANLLRPRGDLRRALPYAQEALVIQRAAGAQEGLGSALSTLALILAELGDLATARGYAEENVAVQRALGHHQRTSLALLNVGHIAVIAHDWFLAHSAYTEGIALAQQHGLHSPMAIGQSRLALLVTLQDDLGGLALAIDALPMLHDYGDYRDVILCLGVVAAQLGMRGHSEPAGRLIGFGERQRVERGQAQAGAITYPASDTLVARARGDLDADAWESACAAGRGLDQSAAVALALEAATH
jgi:tetratricopeptide (TPR) repeat protein